MYIIKSESCDRRITDYVKDQAYVWLYEKVRSGEYVAADLDSETLLLNIKKEGKITDKSYVEFITKFGSNGNNPYMYILKPRKKKTASGITAKDLSLYFVKFENSTTPLPIGFVQEFFQDDYEVQQDVQAFYDEYLSFMSNAFEDSCATMANNSKKYLQEKRNSAKGIFETKFSFHFTNAIRIVLLIIGYVFLGLFISSFIKDITESRSAFVGYVLPLIANLLFLVFLIKKTVFAAKIVVFYARFFYIRAYMNSLDKIFDKFSNSDVINSFLEYFNEINHEFKDSLDQNYGKGKGPQITPEMSKNLPKEYKLYLTVLKFQKNQSKNKVQKKIDSLLEGRKLSVLNFVYSDEDDLAFVKRKWRKGIAFTVIVLIVFAFLNIAPLNNWFNSLF